MVYFQLQSYNNYPAENRQGFTATRTKYEQRKSFTPLNPKSCSLLNKEIARKLKETGDIHFHKKQHKKALNLYNEALQLNPSYVSPYYNIALIYKKQNRTDQEISVYKKLLAINPAESEAQTLLGLCYKKKGDYKTAESTFIKAVKIDPKFDFAQRSLKEIKNLILERENPAAAEKERKQAARETLSTALKLVHQHTSEDLTKGLKGIDIAFGETDSLAGFKNIAQYEDHNRRIVITNDYIWAAPEIIAAYIIHETVHAADRDGISSIKEEQDAYNASIAFWAQHNNGVKDPELDYAAALYRKNPDNLKQKVNETYRNRNQSIPEYSPNHTKTGQGILAKLKNIF